MALPYDLYTRFLVTKGLSLDEVNENLSDLNLKGIDQVQYDRQYDVSNHVLPDTIWKQVEDKVFSTGFLKWMKILEVKDLWEYEKQFRDAKSSKLRLVYDIHDDPKMLLIINALLIKGASHTEICQDINMRFSAMLKEDQLAIYERFFFNPRRMTRKDWRRFLERCSEGEKNIYFTALTESLDVLKAALELTSKISVSDTLQYLLMQSYQKAKHYLRVTGKEANIEARAWIDHVVKLADKYEKHRTGDATDFGKAIQMEFEYIDTDFPSPDESTLKELIKNPEDRVKENDAKKV